MNITAAKKHFKSAGLAAIFSMALAAPAGAAGMLTVDIVFTDLGTGFFQYDLTVSNTGMDEISLISINDAPLNESILGSSLTAPSAFTASYDPGLGIIDLVENTSTFQPGVPVTGISFQSAAQPGTAFTDFSGLTTGGDAVVVTTTLVPEPHSALLAAMGLLMAASVRRR